MKKTEELTLTNKEEKRLRFKKVAENRTDKIIKMIRLLGNCSNTNNYEFTESQVNQIFEAITLETRIAREQFRKRERKKGSRFSLKD